MNDDDENNYLKKNSKRLRNEENDWKEIEREKMKWIDTDKPEAGTSMVFFYMILTFLPLNNWQIIIQKKRSCRSKK